jgi:AMMECR1 domain-containing protein
MSLLTESEQRLLLRLARTALKEKLLLWRDSEVVNPPHFLSDDCGAFVSLHKRGLLRGCVGRVKSCLPLAQTVR